MLALLLEVFFGCDYHGKLLTNHPEMAFHEGLNVRNLFCT